MNAIRQLWSAARQNRSWHAGHVASRLLRLGIILIRPGAHRTVGSALALPKFAGLIDRHPHLPFKYLSRLYLAHGLTTSVRAAVLAHHYRFLHAALDQGTIHAVLAGGTRLWEEELAGSHFRIVLGYAAYAKNEGELTLFFQVGDDTIYHLAFSVVPGRLLGLPSPHALLVTRFQGLLGGFEKIRLATKAMHEVTPQWALFSALQGVARAWGVADLTGIRACRQVCNRSDDPAAFAAAYDRFWETLGASRIAADYFHVPADLPEKPIEAVRQKHRSRTLLKRGFKVGIAASVCEALRAALKPAAAVETSACG